MWMNMDIAPNGISQKSKIAKIEQLRFKFAAAADRARDSMKTDEKLSWDVIPMHWILLQGIWPFMIPRQPRLLICPVSFVPWSSFVYWENTMSCDFTACIKFPCNAIRHVHAFPNLFNNFFIHSSTQEYFSLGVGRVAWEGVQRHGLLIWWRLGWWGDLVESMTRDGGPNGAPCKWKWFWIVVGTSKSLSSLPPKTKLPARDVFNLRFNLRFNLHFNLRFNLVFNLGL